MVNFFFLHHILMSRKFLSILIIVQLVVRNHFVLSGSVEN